MNKEGIYRRKIYKFISKTGSVRKREDLLKLQKEVDAFMKKLPKDAKTREALKSDLRILQEKLVFKFTGRRVSLM